MSAAVVVVWLGTASTRAAHEPDLASWAASRLVGLEEPEPDGRAGPPSHDEAASSRIEGLLSEARGGTYSTDPTAAEVSLDAAEAQLREHPDLPEAAWLMAEAWRARAEIVRSRSPELAAELGRRAEALDGPRARAFADAPRPPGENGAGLRGTNEATEPGFPASPTDRATPVVLTGPLASDDVDIDGVEAPSAPTLSVGTHHVRVLRRGRLAWAGWMTAGAGAVAAPVPPPAPCSETDLAGVAGPGASAATLALVLCPRFIVARPAASDRIEVARCDHSSCSSWLPWSRTWGASFEGPAQPAWPRRPSREWIFWTAAGVAASVVGGLVLWQEGAFDRPGPTRETFTFVPPKAPGR
jgi:hypothetical protein